MVENIHNDNIIDELNAVQHFQKAAHTTLVQACQSQIEMDVV